MAKRNYGWKKDSRDERDLIVPQRSLLLAPLPKSVDLRPFCPPIYDQGQLGSCTGNALAFLCEFDEIKEGRKTAGVPSRLFIYFNERMVEGTIDQDAGAQIRDGIKTLASYGFCNEDTWPYDVTRFTEKPPATCYLAAKKECIAKYARVPQREYDMKANLAAGYPIVLGFQVYANFESEAVAQSGIVPMPAANEECLGGHAVAVVGYNDATRRFIVRNSWGSGWGEAGYFEISYDYFTNAKLSADTWTIRFVPV